MRGKIINSLKSRNKTGNSSFSSPIFAFLVTSYQCAASLPDEGILVTQLNKNLDGHCFEAVDLPFVYSVDLILSWSLTVGYYS